MDAMINVFICLIVALLLLVSGSRLTILFREWKRKHWRDDDDLPSGGCPA